MRALALLPLFFGCATLVDGGRDRVKLSTEPDFAKAIVDGAVHDGDVTLHLDRGSDHELLVRKPGYEDRALTIHSRVSPWFWGNLAFGPLFFVGMIVDAASGALHRLEHRELTVALEPTSTRAGEVARRGAKIDDAIAHERTALGELAPLLPERETQRWVVAVVEGTSTVEPELARAVSDQIRIFLAARDVRVIDGAEGRDPALALLIESLKLDSYDKAKREECQVPLGAALPASHVLRTSVRRFGDTCVTSAELIDLETETAARAVLERSGCGAEEILYAVDRLTARLIRPSVTAGPVALRRGESRPAPQ